MCIVNTDAGRCLPHYQRCHVDVVHSVDFAQSVVISGSRDTTVKVNLLSRLSINVQVIIMLMCFH